MKYQMPEPALFFTENFGLGDVSNVWGYSKDQADEIFEAGRAAGLEAAAKVDFYHLLRLRENLTKNQCYEYHEDIESAIRNLAKEQPCES